MALRLNATELSNNIRIVLIMGVAGAGKTTVGRLLAERLHWSFYDADDFHSPENKAKMASGVPLTDADRGPWLAAIRKEMEACRAGSRGAVFACSALKERYRKGLLSSEVLLAFLKADPETIIRRVMTREDHYMKAGMVQSQFAALEPPADALELDATLEPARIVDVIASRIVG